MAVETQGSKTPFWVLQAAADSGFFQPGYDCPLNSITGNCFELQSGKLTARARRLRPVVFYAPPGGGGLCF